jgi:hypothetical protein
LAQSTELQEGLEGRWDMLWWHCIARRLSGIPRGGEGSLHSDAAYVSMKRAFSTRIRQCKDGKSNSADLCLLLDIALILGSVTKRLLVPWFREVR